MIAVENNWYVITGAPHSGKTSVLELLEKMGYRVIYEAARIYIDQEISKGCAIEEIRKDEIEFQRGILKTKIEIEKSLPKGEIIFFDRAIPDTHAYYKLCGIEEDEFLEKEMSDCLYRKVFLFEPLDYEKDYARTESRAQQAKLHSLLEESYKKVDATIVKIPALGSKKERLKFILKNIT